jgi:predicted acyltransferase
MNSIAAYLIAHLCERFVSSSLRIHLGADAFRVLGPGLQPFLLGSAMLFCYWLILYWMYRRRLFLKI